MKRSRYDFLLESVDEGEVVLRRGEHFDGGIAVESVRRGVREWGRRRGLRVEVRRLGRERRGGRGSTRRERSSCADGLAVKVRSRGNGASGVGNAVSCESETGAEGNGGGGSRYDFLGSWIEGSARLLVRGRDYAPRILQRSLERRLRAWAGLHGVQVAIATAITDPDGAGIAVSARRGAAAVRHVGAGLLALRRGETVCRAATRGPCRPVPGSRSGFNSARAWLKPVERSS